MEHESNYNSYDGEVEDIPARESGNDSCKSVVKITDSDSDSCSHISSTMGGGKKIQVCHIAVKI
jgi:hypothetical protein